MSDASDKQNLDNDVKKMANTRLICQPGRPVFEQGAPASQAFYVEEGKLEVVINEDGYEMKLAEIGPGEIFGEMGVLEAEARFASVRAIEKSVITVIPKFELEERIKRVDDKFVRSLVQILIKRLRLTSEGKARYYKNLVNFQNRISHIMAKAGKGIPQESREAFAKEIEPLLEEVEGVLDRYQKQFSGD